MALSAVLRLSIFIIHIFAISVLAQQANRKNHISIGSILSTSNISMWTSPDGEFAFGFYSITPSQYLLGIWFQNTSPRTLVWTANGGKPVDNGSALKLSDSGLHLFDSRRNLKWSVDESISGAAMRDDGNFVLLHTYNQPSWQSFENPTDTLLPGQTIETNSVLISKASATNYSSGRFKLILQTDSNMVIYKVDESVNTTAIWHTNTWTIDHDPMTLRFDPSGFLYLENSKNLSVWETGEGAGSGKLLLRATLETDGILRLYVWNAMDTGAEASTSGSWSPVWQSAEDPCQIHAQCGFNSFCKLNSQNLANCTCLPGFDFVDKEDQFRGCLPNSLFQICTANRSMWELESTVWSGGYEYSLLKISQSECKQACVDDCMCVVVIYSFGQGLCYKQQMPIISGRKAITSESLAFVEVYEGSQVQPSLLQPNSTPPFPPENRKRKGKGLLVIGISLLACSSTFLGAALLVLWFLRFGPKLKDVHQQQKFIGDGLISFTYKEMEAATGSFREELGRGSCGRVYKGTLSDGRAVAVKSLDKLLEDGRGEKEFVTEMKVVGSVHHRNLVKLYGFCVEGSHRLLVYEYMINGSLDGLLFGEGGFLDWNLRVQIATGIARGIQYLHEECTAQILHCDIKPPNILLDENYNAKVSDFGFAKLMTSEQTRTYTATRGTQGYIAPEWLRNLPITAKADVYSFGMTLLEMICYRKSLKLDAAESEIILLVWIYDCLEQGQLVNLVKGQNCSGGSAIESRQLERMVLIGLWCVQEDPCLRPSMKTVVQMLEGTVDIPAPPPRVSY